MSDVKLLISLWFVSKNIKNMYGKDKNQMLKYSFLQKKKEDNTYYLYIRTIPL